METAAAILVHTIITRTSGLQQLLVAKANQSPQAAVEFLKPYYEAALATVKNVEVENSASRRETRNGRRMQAAQLPDLHA